MPNREVDYEDVTSNLNIDSFKIISLSTVSCIRGQIVTNFSNRAYSLLQLHSISYTAFSLAPESRSNLSTLIIKVPRPPVKLRKCFKYPTISFNGTLAVTCRC
jgi:hypothetical protein